METLAIVGNGMVRPKKMLFVSTNVSKKIGFGKVVFTVQPLANYKCENTASKVNTSNTSSCGI